MGHLAQPAGKRQKRRVSTSPSIKLFLDNFFQLIFNFLVPVHNVNGEPNGGGRRSDGEGCLSN